MSCFLLTKVANNIAFVCTKYYAQVLLKVLSLLNTTWNTYQQGNDTLHDVLQQQITKPDCVFGLKNNDEEFNCLPCIYLLVRNVLIRN